MNTLHISYINIMQMKCQPYAHLRSMDIIVLIMIRLTDPYQCTDQLSVRYVPSYTESYQVYQHMAQEGVPMDHPYRSPIGPIHTTHTERYVTVQRTLALNNLPNQVFNSCLV